jgi:predicted ATP-dependent endonuclease of OLD family
MKKTIFENWNKFLREGTRDTYGSEISDAAEESREDGMEELGLTEKKKKQQKGKKTARRKAKRKSKAKKAGDRCTRIAKRKYDVWPSAYASGAVVRCRQGKIWKGLKEDDDLSLNEEYENLFKQIVREALSEMIEAKKKQQKGKKTARRTAKRKSKAKKKAGAESSKESSLRDWFGRKGAPGKKGGWVDCNTCRKDPKTGRKKCKSCGRQKGEKRSKYPACRPTPGACEERGKGESWGKKS